MPRSTSGRRPLPPGLFRCPVCHEIRGKTPEGLVSACLCQGLVCNWCGMQLHRPMTDQYDRRDGQWWHYSMYTAYHTCTTTGPRTMPQFTALPMDDDLRSYRERVTEITWAEVEERIRQREEARARLRRPDPGSGE